MLSYIEASFRMILSFITGLDRGGGGAGVQMLVVSSNLRYLSVFSYWMFYMT